MPRIVSPERSLFAVIPLHAMRSISGPIMAGPRSHPRPRAVSRADHCCSSQGGSLLLLVRARGEGVVGGLLGVHRRGVLMHACAAFVCDDLAVAQADRSE